MAVINKEIAYMALPLSIRRGNPFPLDEYSVWYDRTQMETYAQTSPVAYVGQILSLVNESSSTVEAYMVQNAAGNLVKLASTTSSGDLAADVLALQGKVSNLEANIGTKEPDSSIVAATVWAAIEEVKTAYEAADSTINERFNDYYNKTETDAKIAAQISSTYKAAGSVAFEDLPALAETEEGKVYNISNAFVTTENFVEGTGQSHAAGTNVVCIDSDGAGTYKWDVLAGFVDLSNYATNEALNNKVDKVEGSSLVENTDIAKLKALANIKTVAEGELNVTAEGQLGVTAIAQSKVTGLPAALEQKVTKEDGKSLVEDTLITKLTNLAEIHSVSSEFTISEAKVLEVASIEQSKIVGLPEALTGKLSGVTVGETPLAVEEGIVTIPVASSAELGVVKSTNAENGITIDGDGNMAVNNINIDKIVQTPGTELILNGGTASIE